MTAKSQISIITLLLAWTLLSGGSPIWAQTATPKPSASGSPENRLADWQTRLAQVEDELKTAPVPTLAESIEQPDQPPSYQVSLLRMESDLRRLISLSESEALVDIQLERVDEETQKLARSGIEQSPPYPITLLDDLQSQSMLHGEELRSQEAALATGLSNVASQQDKLEDAQALRRRLLDQARGAKGVDLQREKATANATAAVEAGQTAVELAKAEVEATRRAVTLARKRKELTAGKIALVQAQFRFSKETLEEQLSNLEKRRRQLNLELDKARDKAASQLEQVKQIQESSSSGSLQPGRVEAMTEWLTTYQREKALLEVSVELNLIQSDLWQHRYQLSQNASAINLSEWKASTQNVSLRVDNRLDVLDNELSQLRARMAGVLGSSSPATEESVHWQAERLQALAVHQTALEQTMLSCRETQSLAQRLLSEIKAQSATTSWRERWQTGWTVLVDVWNIELYTIGDSSVTVGKVSIAFFVLVIGLVLVGRATTFVSRRLLARLPVSDGARGNLERAIRYFFILSVFLFALRVVNIPLTIFTFLGGTLAIAVGFGAQNILNNFISGLILMVERPIRVGDLIEVEQTTGVVEEIGARSTRVRLLTGIHVVLPNSVLLENKVTNWTLTDQRVRTNVEVGVAYGTDPKKVVALIKRAVLQVDRAEKTPEPYVLFDDFADSSLMFSVHFWVSVAVPSNKRFAESEIRVAIEAAFRENGVSIPFPQRDLNFSRPVPVQIVGDATPKEKHSS